MLRIVTMLASYFIGRSLNNSSITGAPAPFLFRLPLLMIRKILKLFLIGFGSLLVSVIGLGFLLGDILLQLQTENQILLKATTGVSFTVALVGIGVCIWTFRKKNWIQAEDLTIQPLITQEVAPQSGLATLLNTLIENFINDKSSRRTSSAV